MFLKYVIRGFMNDIEDKINMNFLNLPDEDNEQTGYFYFYDPLLSFEDRLQKRLSYLDYDTRANSFLCAMWARSSINPLPEQPRQFIGTNVSPNLGLGDMYKVKNVKCQVNLVFVSNDPEYITTFEELFVLNYDRRVAISIDYPIPVDILELGVISLIDETQNMFQISNIVDIENMPIGSKLKVFQSTGNNGEYTLTKVVLDNNNHTTQFYVSETIPSNIPDGTITQKDGIQIRKAIVQYSDLEVTDMNKLEATNRGEVTFVQASMSIQYPVLKNITPTGTYGTGAIIKEIHFKEKSVTNPNGATSNDMIEPYTEIVIE